MPLDERSIFFQYTALLKAIAARRPLLLILEDLHWVDLPSSGRLFHLSRAGRESRILIVGTYRPDEVADSRGAESHPLAGMMGEFKRRHGDIWLDLDNLTPLEGRQFIEAYVDSQPNRLDAAFRAALFRHTGGHALFTVELLHAMQARGDVRRDDRGRWIASPKIDWYSLPAKIEGVIEAQLARLDSTTQALLRVASVQGEDFAAEVIAQVLGLDQQALVQRLSHELSRRRRLVSSQELAWLGQQRLSHYRFRHYLFQRYLYQSLDETERAYLHEAVGNVLENLYGEQAAQIAVQLAHHFRQAGLPAKAAGALLLAGRRAYQLAAYQEAVSYLAEGLSLLAGLPETPARVRQELEFLVDLGGAMDAAGGFSASEVGEVFLRARALCRQTGETRQLWQALYGLLWVNYLRGQYVQSHAYGEEALRLSEEQPEMGPRLVAYLMIGTTFEVLGDFTAAISYFERFLVHYDPEEHQDLSFLHLHVDCRSSLAVSQWVAGYPDQTQHNNETVLSNAIESGHPFVLARALLQCTWQDDLHREIAQTKSRAAALIRLVTEHQFHGLLAQARLYEACVLIEEGNAERGLARLQQAIAELHASGYSMAKCHHASLQARGYAALGQSQAGLDVIDAALAAAHQSGEHWIGAELHRLKGELLLMQGASAGVVQSYFEQAIEIARRQQAKMWELRATVSLCRLWQVQGQSAAAHSRLAAIHGWFTEGFTTPDLLEAKSLLAELT